MIFMNQMKFFAKHFCFTKKKLSIEFLFEEKFNLDALLRNNIIFGIGFLCFAFKLLLAYKLNYRLMAQ